MIKMPSRKEKAKELQKITPKLPLILVNSYISTHSIKNTLNFKSKKRTNQAAKKRLKYVG